MTEEWKTCYGDGIFTEFMEQRGPGHTAGDKKIFTRGFLEVIDLIDKELEKLDYVNDMDAISLAKAECLLAKVITASAAILIAFNSSPLS